MKKLKDFIYDKNDIIIAVLILAVAALVILWRLDIIMEYPKQLIGNDDPVIENPVDSEDPSGDETGDDPVTDDPSGDDPDVQQPDEPVDPVEPDPVIPLWDGGALSKAVEVEVEGASASAAIQCLVEAGLFEDYAEYQAVCEDAGLDHEKVKAGTFTFKQGYTKKDVAKLMNWG